MKRVLLLLMLCPLVALAQTNLVRWNTNTAPTSENANITAYTYTASGLTVGYNIWDGGFRITDFHNSSTGNAFDTSKYIQYSVKANSGYKMTLSNFTLYYNAPSSTKLRAQYSTNQSAWTNLGSEQTINGEGNVSLPFNSFVANPNETIYIRVYLYGQSNLYYSNFYIRNAGHNANTPGPTLSGTVTAFGGPLTAVNDTASTAKNTANTINVLANDTQGSGAITTVAVTTAPSHGSTVVNADKTITYTPANNYTGLDSFTYTVTDTTGATSTATVTVTVLAPQGVPMTGTYTVGTGGDFTTLTAAIANLNQYGVSGPVTFLLNNNVYSNALGETFPLTINQFAGTSAVNTVTFKPAPSKNVSIEASNINNYTGIPAVFILKGADNIIFDGSNTTNGTTRNLTINNKDVVEYVGRAVIWIAADGTNAATNTLVKNVNIRQGNKNQGGKYCIGVYSGKYELNSNGIAVVAATANNDKIRVINNDFMNVKQGVYVFGGTTQTTNVTIHQNDLGSEDNTETIIEPVCLTNVNTFDYTENLVYNLYRGSNDGDFSSAGIIINGNTKNGNILRNNMRNLEKTGTNAKTFAGIILASSDVNANIIIANNFILNVSAQGNGGGYLNGFGIIADTGGGYKIYNNTVVLNKNQPNGGFSAAFYVNEGVKSLDVRNNIFVNNQTNTATRRSAIMVKNTVANINTIFTHLDYNNYFSNDRIGFIGNPDQIDWAGSTNPYYIYTLSAWQSTTGKDQHTVNINPVFASATDLHLASGNTAINAGGTPLADVTKDIDGQLRSTLHPTIGADEYGEPELPTPGTDTGVYCTSSTTWNGTAWSNGFPNSSTDAIFSGNYTQTGGTLEACSIFVLAGAQVNFISNSNAVVTHNVNVAAGGSLTFENSSNLVQIENTANVGNVTVKRNSSRLKRLDYTLWSAPVTGQTLLSFSPATTLDRFYTYNTTTNQYNSVVPSTTTFAAGKGYLIRMPNSNSAPGYNTGTAAIVFNGEFKGVPNNGNVRIPLTYQSLNQSYNAVGNPYPSPINITDFIDANSGVIDGTLYIWRKTNDPTKATYWTCNKAGAIANDAPGGGGTGGNDLNDLIFNPYHVDPTGLLSTGQGFIVRATSANKELVFRNNMRRTTNNSQILRNANAAGGNPTFNRIWLEVVNSTNAFSQTLLGYMPEATTDYDNGFDSLSLMDGSINLYTLQGENTLAIQTRPEFTNTDVVPLGFKTSVAGTFEIRIGNVDGLFSGDQAIYIKDKTTNTVHNLKNSNYSFTTETGVYNDRFEIMYMPEEALGTDNPVVAAKDIIVYADAKQIRVTAPETIKSVIVHDLLGKVVYEKNNIDDTAFTSADINSANQVIIVKVILDNGQAVAKKIMVK